jgi:hypothetical protein
LRGFGSWLAVFRSLGLITCAYSRVWSLEIHALLIWFS